MPFVFNAEGAECGRGGPRSPNRVHTFTHERYRSVSSGRAPAPPRRGQMSCAPPSRCRVLRVDPVDLELRVAEVQAQIAELKAELLALQQPSDVAETRQEDVPPPHPLPTPASLTPIGSVDLPPNPQWPFPRRYHAASRPYGPHGIDSGYGYGGLGITIGGFGFYPGYPGWHGRHPRRQTFGRRPVH